MEEELERDVRLSSVLYQTSSQDCSACPKFVECYPPESFFGRWWRENKTKFPPLVFLLPFFFVFGWLIVTIVKRFIEIGG